METAVIIFIFLAVAGVCFVVGRDNPIDNDVKASVKELPTDEKMEWPIFTEQAKHYKKPDDKIDPYLQTR